MQGFQLCRRLCGDQAAKQVRLVTTMWDEVNEAEGDAAEGRLKRAQWRSFIQAGAQPRRFDNTLESAWNIMRDLGSAKMTLLLQRELVDDKKALEDTAAGQGLPREELVMTATFCNGP